jgi:hypothetical protein
LAASRQSDSAISRLWYFPISAIVRGGTGTRLDKEMDASFMSRIKPQFARLSPGLDARRAARLAFFAEYFVKSNHA